MSTLDVLNDVAEFLEGQSDVVDGSYGEPHANRAMSLLQAVEQEIANLKFSAVRAESPKPQPSVPPHGCGDTVDGRLCHMNLDGTCSRKTCSYFAAPDVSEEKK